MENILHELFNNGYDTEISLDVDNNLMITIFNMETNQTIVSISDNRNEDVNDVFISLIVKLIKDKDIKH